MHVKANNESVNLFINKILGSKSSGSAAIGNKQIIQGEEV
jgi:hypothetical protein